MTPPVLIFSDLDGTLLDYHSYSFAAAKPALDLVRNLNIPLILVSSKTREELIYYQDLIGLMPAPFVVENGSAVFAPPGLLDGPETRQDAQGSDYLILGKIYAELKRSLEEISQKHHYNILGFHNTSLAEIQQKTKLDKVSAQRAMNREFSIPLFFDKRAERILSREMENYQFRILYGGRFMHLLGRTDKGKAVRIIMESYKKKYPGSVISSIALGDSLNDEAMLRAADYPVLVKKHDGSYEQRIKINNLIYGPDIGPAGWNQSVLNFLAQGV